MKAATQPLKSMDDYGLVREAIDSCNQRAYSILVERYRDALHATMLKMVNNREDADDLVIEAFSKAFFRLPTYSPEFAFSTWLFKIAINNSIDFIRRKKMRLISLDEPTEKDSSSKNIADNISAGSPNPEECFIQKQNIGQMRHVISKLSTKYRLMLEMRYFEDMSYQEIADDLGLPIGTVKAQLFRAKELLHEMMRNKPGKAS